MFNDIKNKLKIIAYIIMIVGIIVSIICSLVFFIPKAVGLGVIYLCVGITVSFICSVVFYALGQILENQSKNAYDIEIIKSKISDLQNNANCINKEIDIEDANIIENDDYELKKRLESRYNDIKAVYTEKEYAGNIKREIEVYKNDELVKKYIVTKMEQSSLNEWLKSNYIYF